MSSNQNIAGLIDLANRLVWKNPDLNILCKYEEYEYPTIAQVLQNELRSRHALGKLLLPDLRAFGNNTVAVFSDYGGESSGHYFTYTALVCGYGYIGPFTQMAKTVRKSYKLGEKEIAFKHFQNGPMRRALPEYLEAANRLPGFLCTLAVDKRIVTLFGPPEKKTKQGLSKMLESEGLGQRKAEVTEKLLRVVHFTAFLTALLAHDGQKIFWMTDDDAICANPTLHQHLLSIYDRVLSIYTRPNCNFPMVGGATPFKPQDQNIEMLDLLSITDIVAGSIEPCIPIIGSQPANNVRVKAGADKVLQWLAYDGIGLKKMTIMIRLGKDGRNETGTVELKHMNPPDNATILPITM